MAPVRVLETDLTVYGATGFSGKHVCDYFVAAAASDLPATRNLKLTLAGRDQSKLEAVRDGLLKVADPHKVTLDIFVADCEDGQALKKMASRTQIVVNCAGPFLKYGTKVVESCCVGGADYVDITGEVEWVGEMRKIFGSYSASTGSRIVSFCGFDAIPSDLSVFLAVEALRKEVPEVQVATATAWHSLFAIPNGGTLYTLLETPGNYSRLLFDAKGRLRPVPFFLSDPLQVTHPTLVKHHPDYADYKNACASREWYNFLITFDPILYFGASIQFCMAGINCKVCHASAVALGYGKEFTYGERMVIPSRTIVQYLSILSLIPAFLFQVSLAATIFLIATPFLGRFITTTFWPPGTGSSDSVRNAGFANVLTEVQSEPNEKGRVDKATCEMDFKGDAGNLVTAQCVAEAALSLMLHRRELPKRSVDGFGTPAELLGPVLAKRLIGSTVRKVTVKTNVIRGARRQVLDRIFVTLVVFGLIGVGFWQSSILLMDYFSKNSE